MKKSLLLLLNILFFLTNIQAQGEEVLWLSNLPPGERQNEIAASGMHKLSSINEGRGRVRIVQWVNKGNSVLNSTYLLNAEFPDAEFYCYTPHRDLQACLVDSTQIFKEISFSNQIEGYYNLYLIHKEIRSDTLFIQSAKAELLNHSCRNGHKDVDQKIRPQIYPEKIPLEITRTRTRLENLHFFVSSGDKISYVVSKSSIPLSKATVTFHTHQGWQKTVRSDTNGEAVLQITQDYFSPWAEINNRNIYYYLVIAEHTSKEVGNYQGEPYHFIHYTASLSDGYYPSKAMYSSLSWALGIFLFFSLLIVVGVAYHRRRRVKIYREIKIANS